MLELRASAGLYTHLDGAHARIPLGAFKIGRIAQHRAPHVTNDVLEDPGTGERPLLGDVPDQDGRQRPLLRLLHQAVRAVAHLGDRARRAREIGIHDGLDRVEREHVRARGLRVFEDVGQRCLGHHE